MMRHAYLSSPPKEGVVARLARPALSARAVPDGLD
jgi:hypothetical protein